MPTSWGSGASTTADGPVLVGGIGLPWFAALDIAIGFERRFQGSGWPATVIVEDLSYGAHRVLDRLLEIRPSHVVLVAERGSVASLPSGGVRRCILDLTPPPDAEVHQRLFESVSLGVVDLDHTLAVGCYWKAFPEGTIVIEANTSASVPSGAGDTPAVMRAVLALVQESMVRRPSSVTR